MRKRLGRSNWRNTHGAMVVVDFGAAAKKDCRRAHFEYGARGGCGLALVLLAEALADETLGLSHTSAIPTSQIHPHADFDNRHINKPTKWVTLQVSGPVREYVGSSFAAVAGRLLEILMANCGRVVCLLPGFQEEGYDQVVYLLETIQVSSSAMTSFVTNPYTCDRVGDIVDIKANGAVQKGYAFLLVPKHFSTGY